jgi:hypothetical protein
LRLEDENRDAIGCFVGSALGGVAFAESSRRVSNLGSAPGPADGRAFGVLRRGSCNMLSNSFGFGGINTSLAFGAA